MKQLIWLGALAVLAAACERERKPLPARQISEAEASAAAREHLPWFLERLAAGDPADSKFMMIVRMPAEGGRAGAVLKMRELTVDGDSFQGTVATGDAAWPEYPVGASFRFGPAVVIDWNLGHKKRGIGNFRMRAQMCNTARLLETVRGKTEEVEELRSSLRTALDPATSCRPYDPAADYARP